MVGGSKEGGTVVTIGDRFRIEQTPHGWTLYEGKDGMTKPKEGKGEPQPTVYWTESYYSRLDHAALAILRMAGPGGTYDSAYALVEALDKLGREIVAAVDRADALRRRVRAA